MAGRTRGGAPQRCPSCGAPTLRQWVGDTAALQTTVDLPPTAEPHPYPQAATQATPHDLVWCLPRHPHRALRLRWTSGRHPPDCPHQHLLAHRCPPADPTTLF